MQKLKRFSFARVAGESADPNVPDSLRPPAYRNLLREAPVVLYTCDAAEAHAIRYMTESARKVLGYAPGDFYRNAGLFRELVHPADLPGLLEQLAEAPAARASSIRYRLRVRGGGFRWFQDTLTRIDGSAAGAQICGCLIDMHDSAIAEERAMQNENRLREAQRLANLGNWELDLASGRLHWCDEIFSIFEVDPKQFQASYAAFLERVHPEDREAVDQAYQSSVRDRKPYEIIHRLLMADGRIKHVRERGRTDYDVDGRPLRSIGTVQDFTCQRAAEDALRASNERYRTIFDLEPECLKVMSREGRLLEINRAGLAMLEADNLAQLMARDMAEFIMPPYRQAFRELHSHVLEGGTGEMRFELQGLKGTRRSAHSSIGPLRDAEGNVFATVSVTRDITAEQTLLTTLEAQLEEKRVLLQEVHHRVKNNLHIISSLLYFQERAATTPEVGAAFLQSRNRIHAIALVHESLYGETNLSEVDFNVYVRGLASQVAQALGASARQIHVDVQGTGITLGVNEAVPCGLIINELLTNAIKYAYPGDAGGPVHVRIEKRMANVAVRVWDEGVGYNEESPHGLGLRLVERLAAQLRGSVVRSSFEGRGTAFELEFPRSR